MSKTMIEWENKLYPQKELLKQLNIPRTTFFSHKREGCTDEEAIKRCILNRNQTYFFQGEKRTMISIARQFKINTKTIYKYLNQGKTLEDAVLTALRNKEMLPNVHQEQEVIYYSYKGQELTLPQIAKLENVSPSNLYRRVVKNEENLEAAIAEIKKNQQIRCHSSRTVQKNKRYYKIDGVSLYKYCKEHGYNYDVILGKCIKQNMDPKDALEEYLEKGQQRKRSWKYQYGNVVLKHLLMKYQLSGSYAVFLMRQKDRPLEEIIPNLVFSQQSPLYNKNEGLYLLSIYQRIENLSDEEKEAYRKQLNLTEKEQQILEEKHKVISFIRRELLYYELDATFSTCSEEEKAALIKQHHLSNEELDYMENHLYDDFTLAEIKDQKSAYIKLPSRIDKQKK